MDASGSVLTGVLKGARTMRATERASPTDNGVSIVLEYHSGMAEPTQRRMLVPNVSPVRCGH